MSEKQKLDADIILSNYWRGNAQFADFFNAVLFDGKEVIMPDVLEDTDTNSSTVQEKRRKVRTKKAYHDNSKIWRLGDNQEVKLVLLGMESQEHIYYGMPIRVMGYDYAAYERQLKHSAIKYKKSKNLTKSEWLSGMRKTDKFIPVVTIVVYYGEEPWDAELSLCGILDIPDSIKGVVNDYKIMLVEARNNSLTLHNIDNIGLFGLLSYLLNDTSDKTRKEIEGELEYYIKEHKIDNNVLLTAVAASRCNVNYETLAKKEGTNMISVFQRTWDEGKAEGKIEGEAAGIIKMGHFFGLSESDILDKLQSMLDIPMSAAQEYYKMFGKQTV